MSNRSIVIDSGSGSTRVGYAGDENVVCEIPSVVGYSKFAGVFDGPDYFIGNDALNKSDQLTLKLPIDRGLITNWDAMEKMWSYIYDKELKVESKNQSVLLTDSPLNLKANRSKMAQIMFEKFNVPSLTIANSALLALQSCDINTGVIVDCGDSITNVVPIYEGNTLRTNTISLKLGGRDITDFLGRMLKENSLITPQEKSHTIKDIKEKVSYIAYDFNDELKNAQNLQTQDKIYTLPDGRDIKVGTERFSCTESLFDPSYLDFDFNGIHKAVFNSIAKCDIDIRGGLYENVYLVGGTTLFKGFEYRLYKEIIALNQKLKIKFTSLPDRRLSTWKGASKMAASQSTQWITKQEYEEQGPSIIATKTQNT